MKITESKLRQMIRGVIREVSSGMGGGDAEDTSHETDTASAQEPKISSKASTGANYWYKDTSQDGRPARFKVSDWGKKDAKAAQKEVPAKRAVPANPKKGIPAQSAVAFQPAQAAQVATSGHNAYSNTDSAAKETDSPWVANPDYSDWQDSMADAEAADTAASADQGGQGDAPTGGAAGASTGGPKGKKGKKKKDEK